MYLSIYRTTSAEYTKYPTDTGTIFICTDNNKIYIDKNNGYRADITSSTIICENKEEFDNLGSYKPLSLYIVINETEFYVIDTAGSPKRVYLFSDLIGYIMQSSDTLTPKQLRQDGYNIAPRTTTTALYNEDGINLASDIENLRYDSKHINKMSTKTITNHINNGSIFTIPYPRYDYDINTESMIVFVNDEFCGSDEYTIDNTKIIFNTPLSIDDKITFVFHYHVVKNLNDVPERSVGLESLKEEVYNLIMSAEITDIEFADGSNLSDKLNNILNTLAGNNGESNILNKIEDINTKLKDHINTYDENAESTKLSLNNVNDVVNGILERLTDLETYVKELDLNKDIECVKRVQRGVSKLELYNELIQIELDHEINPEKSVVTVQGDSYYNETPYVYSVEPTTITIRQKSPVSNPDYISYFSWVVVEYY